MMEYIVSPLGDSGLLLSFGNRIDPILNQHVVSIGSHFEKNPFDGLIDIVPAYSSIMFCYDPVRIYNYTRPETSVFEWVKERIMIYLDLNERVKPSATDQPVKLRIPVCYDRSLPNDLADISQFTGLAPDEIISIHMENSYQVYMLGFLPGFAYMGITDERIDMPRKANPGKIQAGSVGLAGRQTGIYSLDSFGGWNILGHTPQKMFDSHKFQPCYLSAGQEVNFYSIALTEYHSLVKKS